MKLYILIILIFITNQGISQDLITGEEVAPFETIDVKVTPLPASISSDINTGNYASAIVGLKVYVAENPDNFTGIYNLGKVLAFEGKYDESLRHLEHAVTIKESANIPDSSIYNATGWTMFLSGDTEGAEKEIKKALNSTELDPKVEEAALNNLGIINMYTKNKEGAKQYLEQAVKRHNSQYAIKNLKILESLQVNEEAVMAQGIK